MDTILKFDKVVLIKELNDKIKKVGDVFEVANVLDNSLVLREAKTKVAVGVVNFEDFDKHFVKEDEFNGWTDWAPIIGFNGQTDVYYKTNRKRVIVKFLTDKVRAESCCCKEDDFNLHFGVQLAYLRCLNKVRAKQMFELETKLKMVNSEVIENNRIIKKMVNSLN